MLALAGCGGSSEPALSDDLAANLSARADRVAAALDAGRDAEARRLAVALRRDARAAVEGGLVPPELAKPLLAGSARLVAVIPEPPPPAQPAAALGEADDEDDEDTPGESRRKKKGHAKEDGD